MPDLICQVLDLYNPVRLAFGPSEEPWTSRHSAAPALFVRV
jgi:hypothetical protein